MCHSSARGHTLNSPFFNQGSMGTPASIRATALAHQWLERKHEACGGFTVKVLAVTLPRWYYILIAVWAAYVPKVHPLSDSDWRAAV